MVDSKFKNILSDSFVSLFRHPSVLLPGIALWFVLTLYSRIPLLLKPYLQTTLALTSWLIISSIIILTILALFFAGLIGLSLEIKNKRAPSFKTFFKFAKKYWLQNAAVLILLRIFSILIEQGAKYLTVFLVNIFSISTYEKNLFASFSLSPAALVFIIIYFIALAGLLMFLTLASPSLIIFNEGILKSFSHSASTVKKAYIPVLVMSVSLLAIFSILDFLPVLASEIIEYVLLVPLISIIVTFLTLAYKPTK